MTIRRLTIAGVTLVAAIGLSGCGPSEDKAATPAGAPATTQQADASGALAAAATKLAEESMHVDITMAGGVSMTGDADSKAQTADMSMTLGTSSTDKLRMIRVGKDMWIQAGGSLGALVGGSGKWMHLDISQMSNAIGSGDPATAAKMLQSAADVQSVGDHQFKGTIDLTKTQATSSAVKSLGEQAKAVPFTAKTDDQGRLVEMKVDMSGVASGAGMLTSTYSDFGTPVSVKAPPKSKVVEAPAQLKGLMNQ
jgi:hypothetical protein